MKVAVGFWVSYDFRFLKTALPLVYQSAHKIVLAMDAQRKTFTGTQYYFEEDFKNWVLQMDSCRKIEWLEEAFYEPGMTPQQVVLKKRNRLLKKMQPAD